MSARSPVPASPDQVVCRAGRLDEAWSRVARLLARAIHVRCALLGGVSDTRRSGFWLGLVDHRATCFTRGPKLSCLSTGMRLV